MATYWTIKVGATEKSLRNWGVQADFSVLRQNKGKSTMRLRSIERFDPGATQWSGPTISGGIPVHTKATVYRDRASADESTNSFSGGTIYFVGYFDDPRRVNEGDSESVEYQIHNVLWLFERNAFKQYYYQFTGFDGAHQRVIQMTVANGSTGYKMGDLFSVNGGTGTACTGIVTAINTGTGAVLLVAITNAGGSYSVTPTAPATTTAGSISGAIGLTVNLTFGQAFNLSQVVASEVYLGENVQQGYVAAWDNGQQITEILNWMNITYNPTRHPDFPGYPGTIDPSQDILQVGTIDCKTWLPTTRMNTLMCMEALNVVLQMDTDAVIVEDPTTTPPTIHVRKLAKWNYSTVPPTFVDYTNLTEVAVTLSTDQEARVIAESKLSKVLPGVMIYYKWTTIVDNVASPHFAVDKADSNGSAIYVDGVKVFGSGSPTITDWTPEVSSHTFQLIGSSLTHATATVRGTPIALLFTNSSFWWGAHDRSLYGPEVTGSSGIDTPQVVDDSGNPIDTTTYAYEIQEPLPYWIGGQVVRATVRQHLFWNRNKNNYPNVPTHISDEKPHTQRVQLTNIPPGTYSTVASASSGEPIPGLGVQSLAEQAYRACAAQQWSGSIELVKAQLQSNLTGLGAGPNNVGFRLKLIGPNTTFSNLLVQAIEEVPHAGTVRVTYGPVPDIDVDQWVTLARASRVRWTWTLPSGRGDGSGSGSGGGAGGGIDLSQAPPLDNSSQTPGGLSVDSVTHTKVA